MLDRLKNRRPRRFARSGTVRISGGAQRARLAADYAFNHRGQAPRFRRCQTPRAKITLRNWRAWQELNLRPLASEASALSAELQALTDRLF